MNLKPILQAILEDYALPLNGDHGVTHWARVLENGRRSIAVKTMRLLTATQDATMSS
ncbi:hypothetical protein Pla110_22170 [Polystyrenella longa]|uniref:Uncharacterized protein n=1 Tax=Polystyrenella longa TaxID=2528007 RepID=A0A518CMN4_9PLAN|nr:hypothetical protein Pla110_22170 [Polystyrenella longa]